MNRLLEEPEVFTVRAEGSTHVILSYTAETAEALGIEEPIRTDGRVHVSFRLSEPLPVPAGPRQRQVVGLN